MVLDSVTVITVEPLASSCSSKSSLLTLPASTVTPSTVMLLLPIILAVIEYAPGCNPEITYSPFASVIDPKGVPSMKTVAPGMGSPLVCCTLPAITPLLAPRASIAK